MKEERKAGALKEVLKCCENDTFDYTKIDSILQLYRNQRGMLITVLQEVQEEFGYLPHQSLSYVAKRMKIPFSRVFGVATFYAQFHLNPRGENIIRVCRGTACHVRGAGKVLDKICEVLQVDEGESTADGKYTVETVACIGACGLAPVIMINNDTFGKLTAKKIPSLLRNYKAEREEA